MIWPKNNSLTSVISWFKEQIADNYPVEEARSITEIIFGHVMQMSGIDLIMKKDHLLSESEILSFLRIIKKLKKHVPVQYITGQAYFFDLTLLVNQHVLIPRPETEELVTWIIDENMDKHSADSVVRIWDIGTGSGAIALALAGKFKSAEVFASDIQPEALLLAAKNAEQNKLKVNFFHHDILQEDNRKEYFSVIVSNPPYIRPSEKSLMKENVLHHEPHIALFVPENDPLLFYRKIARVAASSLKNGGALFVEINEALGKEVVQLFSDEGFTDVILRKDIFGKERFVKGTKKTYSDQTCQNKFLI